MPRSYRDTDYNRMRVFKVLIGMMFAIAERPYTKLELMGLYDLSEKTIRRYLYCIEGAGVPLIIEQGDRKPGNYESTYRIERHWMKRFA